MATSKLPPVGGKAYGDAAARLLELIQDGERLSPGFAAAAEKKLEPIARARFEPLEVLLTRYLNDYFLIYGDALPPCGLYQQMLPAFERPLIALVLKACQQNQLRAAELLGLNRNTLAKKMKELGLAPGTVAGARKADEAE